MKRIYLITMLLVSFITPAMTACSSDDKETENPEQPTDPENPNITGDEKVLIVYYTRSGNTKQMADIIHKNVQGDYVELKTVTPYPESYNEILEQVRQELNSGYKPPLSTKIGNISSYDIIYVGYPIWHGTTPPPIMTFLTEYDFSGKIIVPFCTSGGSSGNTSFNNVKSLCPQATVLDGLQINGGSANSSETTISNWLKRIGIIK